MPTLSHTDWMMILALIFGAYMAWNIGANDVANAFGTSIGSGALTFRQALLIAAVFEFSGAFFAGSHVADTIKGNIIQSGLFTDNPELLARGMMAALLGASIWLHVATWLGQPVSTTHAIIGAVIGFGLTAHGLACVQWAKMGRIAASWFVSPLVGGMLGFLIYKAIRRFILRSETPAAQARKAMPFVLALIAFILLSTAFVEFMPRLLPKQLPCPIGLLSWGSATVVSLLIWIAAWAASRRAVSHGLDLNGQYVRVERWFGRMQVLTACYMSFAHGANDVANAIGPISGLMSALAGAVATKTVIPPWLLCFGGLGIIAGLMTYGYKVIQMVGTKITEVTPTRGFSAEFGTATTVLICSLLGLPISTTFVLVGSLMGVGLARGFGALDLGVVRKIFLSWLVTIPIAAILTAVIYLGIDRFFR